MRRRSLHSIAAGVFLAASPAALLAQQPTDAQMAARTDEYFTRIARLGFSGGVLIVHK
jgi:hypothetical protein